MVPYLQQYTVLTILIDTWKLKSLVKGYTLLSPWGGMSGVNRGSNVIWVPDLQDIPKWSITRIKWSITMGQILLAAYIPNLNLWRFSCGKWWEAMRNDWIVSAQLLVPNIGGLWISRLTSPPWPSLSHHCRKTAAGRRGKWRSHQWWTPSFSKDP